MIAKGKTKEIWITDDANIIIARSTNDITAGNGLKHDTFEGKAEFANLTTCNVFRYLQRQGMPLAFIKQLDDTSFLAHRCEMVSLELVSRRYAYGSWLKRHPGVPAMTMFRNAEHEIFLKTTGQKWKEYQLLCDDPLMTVSPSDLNFAMLYLPNIPLDRQQPIRIEDYPLKESPTKFRECFRIWKETFLAVEKAWMALGYQFIDLKIEIGITRDGRVVVADVIDNDSWRVMKNGVHLDKEVYRRGGKLDYVAALYRDVAQITEGFEAMT
jgi:phosphoribosylaminoimidazole-succinocarboxamide synthase